MYHIQVVFQNTVAQDANISSASISLLRRGVGEAEQNVGKYQAGKEREGGNKFILN